MNWAATWEIARGVGEFVYSVGLLAIGAQMLRAQPGMQRTMNAFSSALVTHAAALSAIAASEEKLDQIAADVAEIKAARVVDPSLLERVYRVLEQREAERRSQAGAP